MSKWTFRTIEQVCQRVLSGGTPSRKNQAFYAGEIPWVKTKELKDCRLFSAEEYITPEAVAASSAKLFPVNTVLMAMYGATVGKLAIAGIELTTNQAACAMIVDEEIADYRFLFYLLKNDRKRIIDLANGAAQQNLSVGVIKQLEFAYPPLETQKAISSVLATLDDKIESNRRACKMIWRLLLLEWESLSTGKEEREIGELMAFAYGKSLPAKKRRRGRVPVYGSGGVTGYHDSSFLEGRAVIVGRKGTVGSVYWSRTTCFPIDTTYYVSPINSWPLLGCYFALVSAGLENLNADSAVPGLNRTTALKQRVFVPPLAEAKEWVQERECLLDKTEQLERETEQLEKLRDALLPELLSGRIQVSEDGKLVFPQD